MHQCSGPRPCRNNARSNQAWFNAARGTAELLIVGRLEWRVSCLKSGEPQHEHTEKESDPYEECPLAMEVVLDRRGKEGHRVSGSFRWGLLFGISRSTEPQCAKAHACIRKSLSHPTG